MALHQLNDFAVIGGLTSLLIVFTTLIIVIYLLYAYFQQRKTLTLVLAFMIFAMGASWFGVTSNFILVSLDQVAFVGIPYMMLASFWIWGSPTATYVATSFIKPEWTKILTGFFVLLALIFFTLIYILVPLNIVPLDSVFSSTPAGSGGLPDAEFKGIIRLYLVVCIGTIVVCGIFFIFTAFKTEIPVVKARGILLGSGSILFGLAGFLDGGVDITSEPVLVIVRLLLITALISIFLSVTLPGFIFKRWGIDKSAKS